MAEIAFEFPDEPTDDEKLGEFLLEDLACALPAYAGTTQDEMLDRLAECAGKSGPLLGEPSAESLFDWQVAIRFAQSALGIQQALNERDYTSVGRFVTKSIVCDEDSDEPLFSLYCLSLPIGFEGNTRLLSLFPSLPWMKRFADSAEDENCSGRRDYAFACFDGEADQKVLDLYLISFEHEIPSGEYEYMANYFSGMGISVPNGPEDSQSIGDLPHIAQGRTLGDIPIDETDAPCIQRLVHALISLHTEGVYVDLFKSDGTKDFLAFRTYLSSLWYDFAMRLDVVKTGYCLECGRGFPLTGHRGIDRLYCSAECRTKAKNSRRRKQVAQLRSMFAEGSSVKEIAAKVYPDAVPSAGCENVRKLLRTWPQLKSAVVKDLESGDGSLTRRCIEDGAIDQDFVAGKANAIRKKEERSRRNTNKM